MENLELYKGATVIIDYENSNNLDLIDFFEEQSLFEGYATITNFDDSYCNIEGFEGAIQLDYILEVF